MVVLKPASLLLGISSLLLASPVPSLDIGSSDASSLAKRAVPVGTLISSCTVPGTVALTFDDGPYMFTTQLLDILANNGVKATFFLNGQNYDSIWSYSSTVQRMNSEGHQIGSHTWSHADLATLDQGGVTSQMTQLEDALSSIIGKFPTYMRPPYLSTSPLSLQTLGQLGYHVINCDIDTLDYENDSPSQIFNSVNNFREGLNRGGNLELSHDVHQNTVQTLAQAMINEVRNRGLRAVTVGECLGDPASNWYRTSR